MKLSRWLRAFLSNQNTLALLVVDLEARSDRLARALRQAEARRVAELSDVREQLAACRREAQSLDAANQAVIAQNQRERLFGNHLAHRNRAGVELADRLPADLAAELRAALAPTFPSEERAHA